MASSIVTLIDSKIPIDGVDGGLDLSLYQRDTPQTIRVVRERDGSISIDPASGHLLEQEIDIPAKQIVLKPVLDAVTLEPVLDVDGQPLIEAEVAPIESVTVITW
jgi:hypothetical protein